MVKELMNESVRKSVPYLNKFFGNHLSLIKDLDKEKNAMISHVLKLGSLINHDGDAEDNVYQKNIL